jgi:pyrimidine operon attenuation protein/uracil phosphoribosyltransferase
MPDPNPHRANPHRASPHRADALPLDPADTLKAQLLDARDLDRTLDRMAREIIEVLGTDEDAQTGSVALVGMQVRGVYLASRLRDRIEQIEGARIPLGKLDATMYRDDFRLRTRQPVVRATDVPFDVEGKHIVLVDDVLYTGRSARAALEALMDLGRPASVRFLVIIDRGLRELPIKAAIVGRRVPTLPNELVRVRLSEIDGGDGVWLVERRADPPASGKPLGREAPRP